MCGRFTLTTPADQLQKHFNLFTTVDLIARYNITPSQDVAVITEDGGQRHLEMMRWGLIPRWAKDASIGNKLANARGETVAEKPSFKAAFRKRRCLVPADGYYEWKKEGKGKQPYWFHRDGGLPLALAGLWETWRDRDADRTLTTVALITTEPNALAAQVHSRMPVLIGEADWGLWLDPRSDLARAEALIRPWEGDDLRAWPVSTRVNIPTHDDPECIAPLS